MAVDADQRNAELAPELLAQIRDFARGLPNMDFYAVLGLESDADEQAIREAFFERSRRFHPDRYFGRELGAYGELLTEVFKRVTAAYEVLKDVELRRAYDRSLPKPGATAAPRPRSEGPPLRARARRSRSRSVFDGLQRQLELTRSKARRHFSEALELKATGDLERARALLRLALIFDPGETRYQDAFGEVAISIDPSRGGIDGGETR